MYIFGSIALQEIIFFSEFSILIKGLSPPLIRNWIYTQGLEQKDNFTYVLLA